MSEQNEMNDPLVGTIEHGGFISETPPDIEDFLVEAGMQGKAYVCTVKRAPMDGSGAKEFLPGSLKGTYMPIEECGKRFGPGQYFYCFSWQTKDPDNPSKQKKMFKEYKIYLGSEWDEIHDEYMAEKWAKRERDIIKTAQKKKLHDAARGIMPDENKHEKDPIEEMKRTMGVMKDIGVPIGPPATSGDANQMMMFMMQMQQKSAETTMQMFMQMQQQSTAMMLAMMKNNQPQGTNDIFKEIIGMVQNTVNLKEALNPEKKGLVDKIFELAESVMPAILALAQKPLAQRRRSPLVETIKNSDDFEKVKNDPEMLNEMIKRWDAAHGKEQTDIILQTVGVTRPGTVEAEYEMDDENPDVIVTPPPEDDEEENSDSENPTG